MPASFERRPISGLLSIRSPAVYRDDLVVRSVDGDPVPIFYSFSVICLMSSSPAPLDGQGRGEGGLI